MKELKLKDNTILNVNDISTQNRLVINVDNFDSVDRLSRTVNNDTLSEFALDGKTYFKAKINEIKAQEKNGVVNVIVELAYDTIQEALDAYTLELVEGGIL